MYGKFIAEGPKIISELLKSNLEISELYAVPGWIETNSSITSTINSIHIISEEELAKISSLITPNQVLAVIAIPDRKPSGKIGKDSMVIALEDIRDPGNLGTIIRIADWFGIKEIICSENCVDAYNPKSVQASMGSIGRVNIYYCDLAEILGRGRNEVPVYGAFLEGTPIYSESLTGKGFIVIGNEANGISPTIEKLITTKISIPPGNNTGVRAESLNASIATAIICSEINRQKEFV